MFCCQIWFGQFIAHQRCTHSPSLEKHHDVTSHWNLERLQLEMHKFLLLLHHSCEFNWITLPEINSNRHWKWMVWRCISYKKWMVFQSFSYYFPFWGPGPAYFSGVSFREGIRSLTQGVFQGHPDWFSSRSSVVFVLQPTSYAWGYKPLLYRDE